MRHCCLRKSANPKSWILLPFAPHGQMKFNEREMNAYAASLVNVAARGWLHMRTDRTREGMLPAAVTGDQHHSLT